MNRDQFMRLSRAEQKFLAILAGYASRLQIGPKAAAEKKALESFAELRAELVADITEELGGERINDR
jgi:hypothetical protein